MRLKKTGNYNPKNKTEEFVVDIIEAKHQLDKKVDEYEEETRRYESFEDYGDYCSVILF